MLPSTLLHDFITIYVWRGNRANRRKISKVRRIARKGKWQERSKSMVRTDLLVEHSGLAHWRAPRSSRTQVESTSTAGSSKSKSKSKKHEKEDAKYSSTHVPGAQRKSSSVSSTPQTISKADPKSTSSSVEDKCLDSIHGYSTGRQFAVKILIQI